MKKKNILYFIFMGFLLYQLIPRIIHNYQSEGKTIAPISTPILGQNRVINFPPNEGNAIAIFWATWCGPCKLEMTRLKASVEKGNIPTERIFAINPFENQETILKFLETEKFPFQFIEASELVKELKVEVTPTTLFIENSKISSRSSGLSIIGIWKAEFLF